MSPDIEFEVAITEIEEFIADRVDGVEHPANGTPWLMLKGVNVVPVGQSEKVARYEALAKSTTDRTLAAGYRELAEEARNT
jgi:hypothetical protein